MDGSSRKAALAAYKERKSQAGVYVVRCTATGQAWVGRTADLAAQRNSLAFQLRHGPNNPDMRDAWSTHGADSFRFEPLDIAPEALTPSGRSDFLKGRAAHWRAALGASPI